ncbi:hypothetical protein D3C77_627100 [compost metagenome]
MLWVMASLLNALVDASRKSFLRFVRWFFHQSGNRLRMACGKKGSAVFASRPITPPPPATGLTILVP